MAYQFYPQQQQQTNGFVSVRNEMEARNYPVAYGNSILFKDETSPYLYTKTMGFSQLDAPRFEKFRIIKEEAEQVEKPVNELDSIKADIEALKKEVFKKKVESNE